MTAATLLRVRLRPLTAFGTPPLGDTLFGQLCWAVRHRRGAPALQDLLHGYTEGKPFAVVSDAFPAGYLPRPVLPFAHFDPPRDGDRKHTKKAVWLPVEALREPLARWAERAHTPDQVLPATGAAPEPFSRAAPQPHNSIDRRTGTTGEGAFAPYGRTQTWYGPGALLDVYLVLDEARLPSTELLELLADIGTAGFGRDASIGLGKFEPQGGPVPAGLLPADKANAYLTLAPCAPQGQGFEPARSHYQVFTRFGRHGDLHALTGRPFKAPVLLARTGAVLTPASYAPRAFIGRGLGGASMPLSKAEPATVQQGYAPVLAIHLPDAPAHARPEAA